MRENFEHQFNPVSPEQPSPEQEQSLSEKEAHFQELKERAEGLLKTFWEKVEADKNTSEILVSDDDFMETEVAVEEAAWAARQAGDEKECQRLREEHKKLMRWRFGE